jgi:hypothetical protein
MSRRSCSLFARNDTVESMKALSRLLIAAALAVPCLQARAADDATCDRYAAEAVSEAAQNAVKMCGFSGPAWGTDPRRDYGGHLNWCLAANAESVDKEASRRRDMIGKCSFCSNYAQLAVDAYDQQEKLFCGNPGGPRWSSNYNGHLQWCFGQEQHVVLSETSARSMLVGTCELCDRYAKDAMRARQEAINNKCDISGPRWSGHSGGHKSWCMEHGMRAIRQKPSDYLGENAWKIEKVARDEELNECKQCRAYAQQAVEQAKKARICYGLRGALWSTSETRHFDGCMAMDDGSRDAETKQQADARAKGLGECKVGVTTRPLDPARATRSGAGSGKSGSSTLKESSPVRTGGKRESKTGGAASSSDAALPGSRAKPLSRGLLESDPGLGPGGPSATGTPAGAPAGGSPAGGGLRLR